MRNRDILLSNEEIKVVNNLIWEKPAREVAAKIGRSIVALHHYIKHRDNYPLSPPPPKSVGPNMPKENGKQLSPSTVNTNKNVPTKQQKTQPTIPQYLKKERLSFANSYVAWDELEWRQVVFQDERKFNLDGPDGFTHYYHDMRNHERTLSQRPRGCSVFIWFAIAYTGPIRCEISTTKFTAESYVKFLDSERFNIIANLDRDFILQDHCHGFQYFSCFQNWGNKNGIESQQWPTIAHDVDIVENVWGWLIREVYGGGRRYTRKGDLVIALQIAWSELPVHFIQNLYSTLPERIAELLYTKGEYTNC